MDYPGFYHGAYYWSASGSGPYGGYIGDEFGGSGSGSGGGGMMLFSLDGEPFDDDPSQTPENPGGDPQQPEHRGKGPPANDGAHPGRGQSVLHQRSPVWDHRGTSEHVVALVEPKSGEQGEAVGRFPTAWEQYRAFLNPWSSERPPSVGTWDEVIRRGQQGAIITAAAAGTAAAGAGALGYNPVLWGSVGSGAALGIGSQAVVAPGLGAGVWPALLATVDGVPDFVTLFDYDQDDRLVALRQTGQGGNGVADKLIAFAYTGDGGLITVSRYASLDGSHHVVTSDYSADELGRLTGLVHYQDPADPLAAYSWTWAGGGNEVEVVTIAAGPQFGSGWMFPMGGSSVHAISVPTPLIRCRTTCGHSTPPSPGAWRKPSPATARRTLPTIPAAS